MDTTQKPRPSEEEMWAGPSGQRWLANALRFEQTLQPIGEALLQLAHLTPGMHVLEVGCGAGGMSLDIARRVAPNGSLTALDISPPLIAEATRRAQAASLPVPTRFLLGDAAKATLPAPADILVSRFGTMFFSNPYAAFANLHSLLKPAGTVALAVWRSMQENPWMFEMRKLMAAHFQIPVPPPRTPGPFAFDDPDYLRDILAKAGFLNINISKYDTNMFVGGPGSSPESAAEFNMQALSIAQHAFDAPESVRILVQSQLTNRLKDFLTPAGVQMPGAIWLVSAQA